MRDIEDYTNSKSKSRISGVSDNSVEQEVFWTSLHVMERQTLEGIASPTTTNGRPTQDSAHYAARMKEMRMDPSDHILEEHRRSCQTICTDQNSSGDC